MTKNTAPTLREKSIEALKTDLQAVEAELADATRSNAAGELPNPRHIRTLRRTIARYHTVLREKNNAAQDSGEEEA